MQIPKIIHQIWIGYQDPPEWCTRFGEEMQAMHPDWEYKLWKHDDIFNGIYKDDIFLQEYVTQPDVYKWAFMADRIRLLLLRDFGGIYCDLDAKPIRPFDLVLNELSDQHTFFAGMKGSQSNNTLIDCTVYGAAPNSRIVNECLAEYVNIHWAHGCKVFSEKIIQVFGMDVALFNYEYFYNWEVNDTTIVLHDVEETRLFSWTDGSNLKKAW